MGYKHSALKAACLAGVCGLIVLTACSNGRPDGGKKTDTVAATAKAVPKDTVVAPPAVAKEPVDTAAYNKKLLILVHNDPASRFLIYKDYPLVEIHPWATHAAVDANCLAAQSSDAYWDFADYIHANQHDVNNEKTPGARLEALDKLTLLQGQKHNLDVVKLQSCIKAQDESAVKASMKEAEGIGVEATPTLFIAGEKIDGAVPVSQVRAALDRALKDAKLPVPEHPAAAPAPASK